MKYPTPSRDWQGQMLGRYRLIQLLGRGGMGEVWLAVDTQLRRQVAVKLLPAVLANDRSYLQNFEREARAAAALEHPHILPVHDFGEQQIADDEVVTYLIMPHITGGSLRDRIYGGSTSSIAKLLLTNEVMHYLTQAAQAIDYAHSQGILHRDIKPANMLLQQDWLLLADFGLAKLLTSTTQRSRTQAGSGTPDYMAPEQARGKAEFASDRYSFAVLAYLLFAGRLPFTGETYYNILMKHLAELPPSPRQFNRLLPQEIEQVLLQGLEKQPQDRPASCTAFVEALAHGWKTEVPADPEITVLAPWNRRRQESAPSLPPVAPTAPEAPALPTSTTYYGTPQVPAPPPDTPASPTTTPEVAKFSRRALLIGGATVLVVGGAITAATLLHPFSLQPTKTPITGHTGPVSHPTPPPGPKLLIRGVPVLSLTGHSDSVEVAAWDPTGRYLATGGYDSKMILWDIGSYLQHSTGGVQSIATPVRTWKLSNTILPNALSWSADGKTIGVVIGDNQIRLFDAFGNTDIPHIYQGTNNTTIYTYLSWSPKAGSFAAAITPLGQIAVQIDVWQQSNTALPARTLGYTVTDKIIPLILSEEHIYTFPPYMVRGFVDTLRWSTDGTLLAAHTNFNFVIIWQAVTGTVKQVFRMRQGSSKTLIATDALAWSPIDPHLLAVSDLNVARVWDIEQNQLVLTLQVDGPFPSLTGLTWSPNGKYIAGSYAQDRAISIWDVQMTGASATQGAVRKPILSFPGKNEPGHSATMFDIAWSPDGRYLATASGDTTVIVWKVDAS